MSIGSRGAEPGNNSCVRSRDTSDRSFLTPLSFVWTGQTSVVPPNLASKSCIVSQLALPSESRAFSKFQFAPTTSAFCTFTSQQRVNFCCRYFAQPRDPIIVSFHGARWRRGFSTPAGKRRFQQEFAPPTAARQVGSLRSDDRGGLQP